MCFYYKGKFSLTPLYPLLSGLTPLILLCVTSLSQVSPVTHSSKLDCIHYPGSKILDLNRQFDVKLHHLMGEPTKNSLYSYTDKFLKWVICSMHSWNLQRNKICLCSNTIKLSWCPWTGEQKMNFVLRQRRHTFRLIVCLFFVMKTTKKEPLVHRERPQILVAFKQQQKSASLKLYRARMEKANSFEWRQPAFLKW